MFPLAKGQRQRALDEGPLPFLFNMKAQRGRGAVPDVPRGGERQVLRGEGPAQAPGRQGILQDGARSTWRRPSCCRRGSRCSPRTARAAASSLPLNSQQAERPGNRTTSSRGGPYRAGRCRRIRPPRPRDRGMPGRGPAGRPGRSGVETTRVVPDGMIRPPGSRASAMTPRAPGPAIVAPELPGRGRGSGAGTGGRTPGCLTAPSAVLIITPVSHSLIRPAPAASRRAAGTR